MSVMATDGATVVCFLNSSWLCLQQFVPGRLRLLRMLCVPRMPCMLRMLCSCQALQASPIKLSRRGRVGQKRVHLRAQAKMAFGRTLRKSEGFVRVCCLANKGSNETHRTTHCIKHWWCPGFFSRPGPAAFASQVTNDVPVQNPRSHAVCSTPFRNALFEIAPTSLPIPLPL